MQKRLKEGGWVLERRKRHKVFMRVIHEENGSEMRQMASMACSASDLNSVRQEGRQLDRADAEAARFKQLNSAECNNAGTARLYSRGVAASLFARLRYLRFQARA